MVRYLLVRGGVNILCRDFLGIGVRDFFVADGAKVFFAQLPKTYRLLTSRRINRDWNTFVVAILTAKRSDCRVTAS